MEKPLGMPFSETYKIYVSVIEEEFRTYDCKTDHADITHAETDTYILKNMESVSAESI